jgi:hypothetical protein
LQSSCEFTQELFTFFIERDCYLRGITCKWLLRNEATMDEVMFSQGQALRCGYTTGSCAAAATKAATEMLLTGTSGYYGQLLTPKGHKLDLEPERYCS